MIDHAAKRTDRGKTFSIFEARLAHGTYFLKHPFVITQSESFWECFLDIFWLKKKTIQIQETIQGKNTGKTVGRLVFKSI